MADDAKEKAASDQAADDQSQAPPEKELKFDDWYKEQPAPVKAAIDGHIGGLKNALTSEREMREDAEKQMRELAKNAIDPELKKQLEGTADQMALVTKRLDAYETLHQAGVSNLKAAWTLIQSDELFDRKGEPDIAALKQGYPELFGKTVVTTPAGNAGSGTGGTPKPKTGMNDFIRTAARRG